jgi:hypothetical protein
LLLVHQTLVDGRTLNCARREIEAKKTDCA